MDTRTIELKYRRSDFEEVYFRNDAGKTYFNAQFKRQRNKFILLVFSFFVTLLYVLLEKINYELLFVVGGLLCIAFYEWFKKVNSAVKLKREVSTYLDNLDKVHKNTIVLSASSFCLIQDQKQNFEKWSEFTSAQIEEDYISLKSNTSNYLIPKKSMTDEEYSFLRNLLAENIIK